MRIIYIGNFEPEHSTENHVRQALEALGHQVLRAQEGDVFAWQLLLTVLGSTLPPDLVLWTSTHGLAERIPIELQEAVLDVARGRGVPTVGYHLDRWWGLARQDRIGVWPFFQCQVLCTADGDPEHAKLWAQAGVQHWWFPPAVSMFECKEGTPRPHLASPAAFVGSWQGGYHPEHAHRAELIEYLLKHQAGRVALWPKAGQPALRGAELRDLYASVPVLVGDSCLTPNGLYWSDRIPETLGRGGFLLHPEVPCLEAWFRNGHHLVTWRAHDWDHLGRLLAYWTDPEHEPERADIARRGRAHVLARHTYTVRMAELLSRLHSQGMFE